MRGTTPTHTFTLPFDTGGIQALKVTYARDGEIVLTKEKANCVLEGDTVSVRLTQEETLLFDNRQLVQIQLRVLLENGDALCSDIYHCHTGMLLDDEVME